MVILEMVESRNPKRRLAAETSSITIAKCWTFDCGSRSLPGGTGTVPHALGDDDDPTAGCVLAFLVEVCHVHQVAGQLLSHKSVH
jgi:hypothetical protein